MIYGTAQPHFVKACFEQLLADILNHTENGMRSRKHRENADIAKAKMVLLCIINY